MPLNWNTLDALTHRKFIPILADNVYKSNPLFIQLNSKGRIVLDGGRSIVEPVLYNTQGGGAYSKFQALDVTPREIITDLELNYKLYYAGATLAEEDILKNSGSSKVLDYVAAYVENMEHTLRDLLGTALFKLTPTAEELDSLAVAINTGNTYAGIDRTTYTWWNANVINAASAEPSFNMFQEMYGKCTQGNTSPDLIVTTQRIFDKLWALALPQQRFPEGDEVHIGWPMLRFNRAKVVVDSHCTSGRAYFLNTDYVKLVVHRDRDFVFTGWMPFTSQDARHGRVHWSGNLVVNAPRFCGVITNISEA